MIIRPHGYLINLFIFFKNEKTWGRITSRLYVVASAGTLTKNKKKLFPRIVASDTRNRRHAFLSGAVFPYPPARMRGKSPLLL